MIAFREPSWYNDKVFQLLEREGVGICLHDMAGSRTGRMAIGPLVYVRFHGPAKYAGRYDDRLRTDWAQWLVAEMRNGRQIFACFNIFCFEVCANAKSRRYPTITAFGSASSWSTPGTAGAEGSAMDTKMAKRNRPTEPSVAQRTARVALGALLLTAGVGHLTLLSREFRAQVPNFVPLPVDVTVRYSGYVELAIGTALIASSREWQPAVGRFTGAFFAAVFPGNVAQWLHRRDAFGLDTDGKRLARLFFQPALIYWALACTAARMSDR